MKKWNEKINLALQSNLKSLDMTIFIFDRTFLLIYF